MRPSTLIPDVDNAAVGNTFALLQEDTTKGIGSLMAFPGSMFGALVCGIIYAKTKNVLGTLIGEVFGTALLGGLCAYPIAIFFMGSSLKIFILGFRRGVGWSRPPDRIGFTWL